MQLPYQAYVTAFLQTSLLLERFLFLFPALSLVDSMHLSHILLLFVH